jgi:hypothetical protein
MSCGAEQLGLMAARNNIYLLALHWLSAPHVLRMFIFVFIAQSRRLRQGTGLYSCSMHDGTAIQEINHP